jgi:hypothetical protein
MDAGLTRKLGSEETLHFVTRDHSGGNGCCEMLQVWQIEPGQPRRIYETTLSAGCGDAGEFTADPYQQGPWNLLESVFIHRMTSKWMPRPEIIVSFGDVDGVSTATVDAEAMRIPPPPRILLASWRRRAFQELARELVGVDAWSDFESRGLNVFTTHPPQSIVQPMLLMFYCGHPERAWQFFAEVWSEHWPLRDAFAREMQQCLDDSQYYPLLPWSNVRWPGERTDQAAD